MSRDHGGGLDAAVARWGGRAADWLDLSTGINPVPYPLPDLPPDAWTRLPDRAAQDALERAARSFWAVSDDWEVVPAPGLSALIARLPWALGAASVRIPAPTYNEHAASFAAHGIPLREKAPLTVVVHPNNPDGRLWEETGGAPSPGPPHVVIDESFCDPTPALSHMGAPGAVILKSFGKFWGLAGLRLGFAMTEDTALAQRLRDALGPWPVSGPALAVGTAALSDAAWADAARTRLDGDAARLDALLTARGAQVVGGTTLFRLYEVADAAAWADRLARRRILARTFPYSATWLRLGLPALHGWERLEAPW
jgi:cobalamin biosynthesis protein CobC